MPLNDNVNDIDNDNDNGNDNDSDDDDDVDWDDVKDRYIWILEGFEQWQGLGRAAHE